MVGDKSSTRSNEHEENELLAEKSGSLVRFEGLERVIRFLHVLSRKSSHGQAETPL